MENLRAQHAEPEHLRRRVISAWGRIRAPFGLFEELEDRKLHCIRHEAGMQTYGAHGLVETLQLVRAAEYSEETNH